MIQVHSILFPLYSINIDLKIRPRSNVEKIRDPELDPVEELFHDLHGCTLNSKVNSRPSP